MVWAMKKTKLLLEHIKGPSSQGYSFPVVMYGCESWTVKKAERQKIDAFELWCWRRLLRVPWTVRRSNQFILKEISPGYSLEGLMLKLKLQYFGHLMWRVDSLGKTLMLGEIGGRRRRGQQRMRWLDGISDSMDMILSKLRELVMDREAWHAAIHGVQRVGHAEWLNWTELIYFFPLVMYSYVLSAGVLHLMMYSWYVHGERCAPCLPTPPPSFIYNSYCHTYFSELWFLIIYCSYVWARGEWLK